MGALARRSAGSRARGAPGALATWAWRTSGAGATGARPWVVQAARAAATIQSCQAPRSDFRDVMGDQVRPRAGRPLSMDPGPGLRGRRSRLIVQRAGLRR